MLNWVITFFILAVLASFFGFGGMAADFAGIAKFLALIFVVLFLSTVVGIGIAFIGLAYHHERRFFELERDRRSMAPESRSMAS